MIAFAAVVVGFVWLPQQQRGERYRGVWEAICSAAGLVRHPPTGESIVRADYPTTRVEIVPRMLAGASAVSIGRGATLALRCSMCHGARGLSQADIPNLAGQYAVAIYKQLADFRTGARTSAVMAPLVGDLRDSDMRDLAAYYAYLPRLPAYHPTPQLPKPNIVIYGAPLRGIAPCGACHGSLDNKTGSPWLEGQSEAYMKAQLQAFASGERRNDISQQMRNIARALTPQEIDEAAAYYASQPAEVVKATE